MRLTLFTGAALGAALAYATTDAAASEAQRAGNAALAACSLAGFAPLTCEDARVIAVRFARMRPCTTDAACDRETIRAGLDPARIPAGVPAGHVISELATACQQGDATACAYGFGLAAVSYIRGE